ncbi:membrane-spanning 4-domains subfamily A member 4A-like [Podarcis lilfordi]|uniref:Membrane-spanning 4-domains subfamily A member 4A-like n=1 Tax=Podarcis lilfordi TaxID=74358 RepID=A0AA35PE22_9SAUR|nr:membrane-spanning 4-domains subfamily A member 4A-like [Podarcis lilfordi]
MDSHPIAPLTSRSFSRDESDAYMPKAMKKFYRGEPLALGITQILIGIMQVGLGAAFHTVPYYYRHAYIVTEVPIWSGILYIISGSLSVAAARNPKIPLVKGMLGMNVVSSVAAGIGIIFLCFSMGDYHWHRKNMLYGILAVFLVFNILAFCIAISTSAFGCKTVCQENYTETVVVVYQNVSSGDSVALPDACKDPRSL